MGLFSRKKTTYVSSVVYNLAGNEDDRPDFLKTTVFSAVLSEQESIAETMTDSYLHGSGIKLRNFARWARTQGYDSTVGLATGKIISGDSINISLLPDEIPHSGGTTVSVQTAQIDNADYTYWADQYVSNNYPSLLGTNYLTDMDSITGNITITFVDTTQVTFTPVDFDINAQYLYVSFMEVSDAVYGSVVTGSTITITDVDPFPSIVGWDEQSNVVTTHTHDLDVVTTVDVTYSDATPPEHTVTTTTSSESYDEIHAVYEQINPLPPTPGSDSINAELSIMYHDQVGSITTTTSTSTVVEVIAGVTKTTVTTVVTEIFDIDKSYRIDTQHIEYRNWSPLKVFIYKEDGANSVLNAMFKTPTNIGSFFPFIPFRVDNQNIPQYAPDTIYPASKKAFKKATGGKYDTIMGSILDNPDIGDIDFTYAVFGVSLNVKENACRKYIYNFLKFLNDDPTRKNSADYQDFITAWNAADDSWTAWLAWRDDPYSPSGSLTAEPVRLVYPPAPMNSIRVSSDNTVMHYDIKLSWAFIEEEIGSGLLKPTAKKGDYWLTSGTSERFEEQTWSEDGSGTFSPFSSKDETYDLLYVNYQESETVWKRLVVRGLRHTNSVYNGQSVVIGSKEALEDTEESGFIMPLHEDVYKEIGVIDGTQMATACCFLMFNCYQVVKQKWYQTSLFKIVLVIIVVVVTIMSAGAAGPAAGGLLGTNAAVGGALGLTGTLALVAGALINIIAAMVVVSLIQKGATKLFGEKLGLIIGTILSIVTLQVGTAFATGTSITSSFANLMRADSLLLLTSSVGDAYGKYINYSTQELMLETEKLNTQFENQLEELENKYALEFGRNGLLDPNQITDILFSANEPPEAFLQRTLMVGSDIADMSLDMLTNFTKITLSTELTTV